VSFLPEVHGGSFAYPCGSTEWAEVFGLHPRTKDLQMRQTTFLSLREDKDPKEVVREV
jgi:hypothetical protein